MEDLLITGMRVKLRMAIAIRARTIPQDAYYIDVLMDNGTILGNRHHFFFEREALDA